MKNYQALSRYLDAYNRCIEHNNKDWEIKHAASIDRILKSAPSGSGIDAYFNLDTTRSTPEKLIFVFSFHHMNENGMYDGWTNHKAILTGSLMFNYTLKITGRDRNQIKDYLYQTISFWLEEEEKS